MTRWRAEYDEQLRRLHSLELTDHEILGRLLDQNIAVSYGDVIKARQRLKLKSNTRHPNMEMQGYAPKDKPNPILMARQWLGNRIEEKNGGYWLDGLPVSSNRMMQEYNRMRVGMKMEQVLDNYLWEWKS